MATGLMCLMRFEICPCSVLIMPLTKAEAFAMTRSMLKTLCLLTLWLSSCSYTVRRNYISLGGEAATNKKTFHIFVPVVDNLSYRTGFEATITSALRENLAAVKGLDVIRNEEEADYILLATINDYRVLHGKTPVSGSTSSEAAGGLTNKATITADIRLIVVMTVRFVERSSAGNPQRELWSRPFQKEAVFEASTNRLTEVRGSSSAVHVNNSREATQFKILADNLAKLVVDQVAQAF